MTVTAALADRFNELGFRVIEGGRSTKLVVVNSVRIAERFDKNHKRVLEDIDHFIESHGPNLGHEICLDVHIRKSNYISHRGRKERCYDLTQIGFEAIALGYDAELRFRYVLAFHELEEELGLRARSITRKVIDRLQEIRGDWVQPELDLGQSAALDELKADYDALASDPEMEATMNDEGRVRGAGGVKAQSDAHEMWHERESGVEYQVTVQWPHSLTIVERGRARDLSRLLIGDLSMTVASSVPDAIIWRVIEQLPQELFTPTAMATIKHFFADSYPTAPK